MTDPAVAVTGLRKAYGDVQALRGVDFEVSTGEIFGLVGPNGAGKSTTLRSMSTLLIPDDGDVRIFGADVDDEPNAARAALRYVPEEAGAYENQTGRQYLDFVADFYVDEAGPTVDRGVELADLGARIDDKTGAYSKGMTRKLLLASALMPEPDLAILDEPTAGLDVRNARQVRESSTMFVDVTTLSMPIQAILLAIPFTHPALAPKELMFGSTALVLGGIVYQAVIAAATIAFAIYLFNSDPVVTGNAGRIGQWLQSMQR